MRLEGPEDHYIAAGPPYRTTDLEHDLERLESEHSHLVTRTQLTRTFCGQPVPLLTFCDGQVRVELCSMIDILRCCRIQAISV